jgi:hypothetical protein
MLFCISKGLGEFNKAALDAFNQKAYPEEDDNNSNSDTESPKRPVDSESKASEDKDKIDLVEMASPDKNNVTSPKKLDLDV